MIINRQSILLWLLIATTTSSSAAFHTNSQFCLLISKKNPSSQIQRSITTSSRASTAQADAELIEFQNRMTEQLKAMTSNDNNNGGWSSQSYDALYKSLNTAASTSPVVDAPAEVADDNNTLQQITTHTNNEPSAEMYSSSSGGGGSSSSIAEQLQSISSPVTSSSSTAAATAESGGGWKTQSYDSLYQSFKSPVQVVQEAIEEAKREEKSLETSSQIVKIVSKDNIMGTELVSAVKEQLIKGGEIVTATRDEIVKGGELVSVKREEEEVAASVMVGTIAGAVLGALAVPESALLYALTIGLLLGNSTNYMVNQDNAEARLLRKVLTALTFDSGKLIMNTLGPVMGKAIDTSASKVVMNDIQKNIDQLLLDLQKDSIEASEQTTKRIEDVSNELVQNLELLKQTTENAINDSNQQLSNFWNHQILHIGVEEEKQQ